MVKEIPLTKGYVALVDDEDYELVSRFKWYACELKTFVYAYSSNKPHVAMHRVITQCSRNLQIDHINHNTLDNRKENLRKVSKSQNMANQLQEARKTVKSKSKYKGVCLFVDHRTGWTRWRVQLSYGSKRVFCKYFISEKEAALAYNDAALVYFGEFARLNEIKEAQ